MLQLLIEMFPCVPRTICLQAIKVVVSVYVCCLRSLSLKICVGFQSDVGDALNKLCKSIE